MPKTKSPGYGSRPIRTRRTQGQMDELRQQIYAVVREQKPMTVRQVFYQLVSRGVIEKTEAAYKGSVVRVLTDMRLERQIPFHWLADNTRWMRKPETHSGLRSMLNRQIYFYRRALWDNQPDYVEIWLEKDALSGVLYSVTERWDVPLMVTRGYPSLTYVASAAETIEGEEKPAYLYYFGDYDPSGVDIPRHIEERLCELAPDAEIHFERVAVNPEQISEWNLPTRPTKATDARSKTFEGESVEVDAIPPHQLRELVEEQIVRHIDTGLLERTQQVEKLERESVEMLITRLDEIDGGEDPDIEDLDGDW